MGAGEVAERTGMSRSAVERAIREVNPTEPHTSTKSAYLMAAAEWAADRLRARGVKPTMHPLGTVYCYWRELGRAEMVRTCECGCGFALPPGRRRWYSDAHRKRAEREMNLSGYDSGSGSS